MISSILFRGYWGSFQGLKCQGLEAVSSLLCHANVEDEWKYESAPFVCLCSMYKDNFTLSWIFYIYFKAGKLFIYIVKFFVSMSEKNYNLQYVSLLDLVKVMLQWHHVFSFFLGCFVSFVEKRVTYCIECYHRNIVLFKGMAMSVFQFTIGIALNFKGTWEMTQCSCCSSCAGHTNYFKPQRKHL